MRKDRFQDRGNTRPVPLGATCIPTLLPWQHGDAPGGTWEARKFNASLYDIQMVLFADKDKNQVMANLDAIREALIVLMTEDQSFINSILLSTSSTKMVTNRFDIWRRTLDAILNSSARQPRTFSRALKQALFDANHTCGSAISPSRTLMTQLLITLSNTGLAARPYLTMQG